jgi:hypothetical protein
LVLEIRQAEARLTTSGSSLTLHFYLILSFFRQTIGTQTWTTSAEIFPVCCLRLTVNLDTLFSPSLRPTHGLVRLLRSGGDLGRYTRWFARLDFYFILGLIWDGFWLCIRGRMTAGDGRVKSGFISRRDFMKKLFYEGMMDAAQGKMPFLPFFTPLHF